MACDLWKTSRIVTDSCVNLRMSLNDVYRLTERIYMLDFGQKTLNLSSQNYNTIELGFRL